MESILLEFYKMFSQDKFSIVRDNDYAQLNDKIRAERDYLISKLQPEDGQRLICLEELYTAASNIDEAKLFCEGFRLAVLLMAEAYNT